MACGGLIIGIIDYWWICVASLVWQISGGFWCVTVDWQWKGMQVLIGLGYTCKLLVWTGWDLNVHRAIESDPKLAYLNCFKTKLFVW